MDHLIFEKIAELQIIICRHCKHGVYPNEEPATVYIPRELENPLPIIPVYTNGMQCRRDPQCRYIGSYIKTMRKHWQAAHGWTQHQKRGHVTTQEKEQGKAELQQLFRPVAWQ
ncbi:uncharacterized protein BDV17DRAFT_296865 [Aspergillus undulatus]|uniref:uncharacterized protein n=1 Tax=Aspergillus undulatus TaxID=1810928 RepID=UPI003CCCB1F1